MLKPAGTFCVTRLDDNEYRSFLSADTVLYISVNERQFLPHVISISWLSFVIVKIGNAIVGWTVQNYLERGRKCEQYLDNDYFLWI